MTWEIHPEKRTNDARRASPETRLPTHADICPGHHMRGKRGLGLSEVMEICAAQRHVMRSSGSALGDFFGHFESCLGYAEACEHRRTTLG